MGCLIRGVEQESVGMSQNCGQVAWNVLASRPQASGSLQQSKNAELECEDCVLKRREMGEHRSPHFESGGEKEETGSGSLEQGAHVFSQPCKSHEG